MDNTIFKIYVYFELIVFNIKRNSSGANEKSAKAKAPTLFYLVFFQKTGQTRFLGSLNAHLIT